MPRKPLSASLVIIALAGTLWRAAAAPDSIPQRGTDQSSSINHASDLSVKALTLLERRCVHCHSGTAPKGGLSLTSLESAKKGGESGPAILPGKPEQSLVIDHVSGDKPEMPKDGAPLGPNEVALLRGWIKEGAAWPEAAVHADKKPLDLDWWSLKPLANAAPPRVDSKWVRTPVDAFILAKLNERKLAPAPAADRRTLIRRLTYDLHGLPPTPEEVAAFQTDRSPDAYEKLIDRLLASPRYGECWGRHWLDVVHFGETHGYDKDKPRPHAWPYRDYVIKAFNSDKPYSRFVEEQIAGDVLYSDDPDAIIATGFVAAGPWDYVGQAELREGTVDKDIARLLDRDDMVMTTMSTFTSLTVHCARCHDHKFDPIRQEDYYRLQAVFAGVDRADRAYDVDSQVARARQRLETKIAVIQTRQKQWEAGLKPAASDSGVQEEPQAIGRELDAAKEQLAELPPPKLVYAATHDFASIGTFVPARKPRLVFLLERGNVRAPKQLMTPGALTCVAGMAAEFHIDDLDNEGLRRAALAHWLTDQRNAIVRRSIVNRVWQSRFGEGLVDSPNDFGRMGSQPSHPELLDWLANWFMAHAESIKALDRLILTSAVYRQSSLDNADFAKIDTENRFLWRMNRRRLDAESIHDAMLAADGKLDFTMGGESVRQFWFKDDHSPVYDYDKFDIDDPKILRRSVYRFIVRSVPDPFMESLDCADPSILTPKRNTTLTAIQALAMLNDRFVLRQAEHLANRVRSMCDDPAGQIAAVFLVTLSRKPTPAESKSLLDYAARHGLENACRVIFNCNEFVFID
jgi:hypothetical protein